MTRVHNGPGGEIDPMSMPRRADYLPSWYEPTTLGICRADACRQGRLPCQTPEACRLAAEDGNSDFGALEGLVRGSRYIAYAWAVIAAVVAAAYIIWS